MSLVDLAQSDFVQQFQIRPVFDKLRRRNFRNGNVFAIFLLNQKIFASDLELLTWIRFWRNAMTGNFGFQGNLSIFINVMLEFYVRKPDSLDKCFSRVYILAHLTKR